MIRQVSGSFDRRLAEAWIAVGGPGMQIGMDTPQITSESLDDSLAVLEQPNVDATLGLAPDGGWWSIGLRVPQRRVFVGVAMSCADTGSQQLRRLEELRLRTRLLPELRDIDEYADALAVVAQIPESRTAHVVARLSVSSVG